MSDQWSTPSLYSGRGRSVEPRTFTEADPISAMLVADWFEDPGQIHENPWSSTTYVGPRRKRPDRKGRRAAATTEAPPQAASQAPAEAPAAREVAEEADG